MMSLDEFAKCVEERVGSSSSAADRVHQFLVHRWYRIENAYMDASAKAYKQTSAHPFEDEIITVSYAMSLDFRLSAS